MAALDWSQCPAVESIPGKVSGAWVFKNTRMPVHLSSRISKPACRRRRSQRSTTSRRKRSAPSFNL